MRRTWAMAAGGMVPDPTGLWYIPEESGQGAAIVQQNDTVFVVLFVYDDQRRPAWFVASSVRDSVGADTHAEADA